MLYKNRFFIFTIALSLNIFSIHASYFSKINKKITSTVATNQLAAINKNTTTENVAYLLKKGANPNTIATKMFPKKANRTVLHAAIQLKKPEIIKLLLDYGADPLLISSGGRFKWKGDYYDYNSSIPLTMSLDYFEMLLPYAAKSKKLNESTLQFNIIKNIFFPHVYAILKTLNTYKKEEQERLLILLTYDNYKALQNIFFNFDEFRYYNKKKRLKIINTIDLYISYLPESVTKIGTDLFEKLFSSLNPKNNTTKYFDEYARVLTILISHNANPYLKNEENKDAFSYAPKDIRTLMEKLYKKHTGETQKQHITEQLANKSQKVGNKIRFTFGKKNKQGMSDK